MKDKTAGGLMLVEIEQLVRAYADAREVLSGRVQSLQAEIESAKRRKLAGIKKAVAACADAHDALSAAIQAAPGSFTRPKTKVICGIRIGFARQKIKLVINDEDKTLQLIRRHFADLEEALIKVTEKPIRKALEGLSAAELKRIGVTVVVAGEKVMIKPTDSEVDKLVNALLAEAENIIEETNQ